MTQRGLSLVEILIALAIIGISLGVLVMTQATTMRVGSDSRRASNATEVANRLIEERVRIVLSDFAGVQAACSAAPCEAPFDDDTVDEGRVSGNVVWEVPGTGYLDAGLVRVTVNVVRPSAISFSRLVSCIDISPPPSVAQPQPCPPPVE